MMIERLRNRLPVLLFSLLALGCSSEEPIDEPSPVVNTPPIVPVPNELPELGSVLFVGNSLTYVNDLPLLVSVEANKKGYSLRVSSIAIPNSALEDHWKNGEVQQLLQQQHFDFVVVQQGPSSQVDGRVMLQEYGAKFKDLCDKNGAQLAFFMVWPARANYLTFDGVIQNYTDAAIVNNAILCPVGKAWKEYMDATSDFSYYGPDQFHPSMKGSEVAAQIIFSTLFP